MNPHKHKIPLNNHIRAFECLQNYVKDKNIREISLLEYSHRLQKEITRLWWDFDWANTQQQTNNLLKIKTSIHHMMTKEERVTRKKIGYRS